MPYPHGACQAIFRESIRAKPKGASQRPRKRLDGAEADFAKAKVRFLDNVERLPWHTKGPLPRRLFRCPSQPARTVDDSAKAPYSLRTRKHRPKEAIRKLAAGKQAPPRSLTIFVNPLVDLRLGDSSETASSKTSPCSGEIARHALETVDNPRHAVVVELLMRVARGVIVWITKQRCIGHHGGGIALLPK